MPCWSDGYSMLVRVYVSVCCCCCHYSDPHQLPPLVTDVDSSSVRLLERAQFSRLRELGVDTTLLSTQYRMPHTLSAIPNKLFYDSLLRDGVSEEQRFPFLVPPADAQGVAPLPLQPLTFVNVPD